MTLLIAMTGVYVLILAVGAAICDYLDDQDHRDARRRNRR